MYLTYKHILLFTAIVMTHLFARSQNLVANPGFEDVNICVEFRAPCTPSAWESVAPETKKLEYLYHTYATGGNNLIRLTAASPFPVRNYAQTQLLCPLEKGRQYRVTLLAAAEEQDEQVVPEIDVRFDTGWTYRIQPVSLSGLQPTLRTGEKDVVKKIPGRKTFYLLQQDFTAKDTFTHVVLGCFRESRNRYDIGYLLIDSISIAPVGNAGPLCANAVNVRQKLYAQHYRHTLPDRYYHALQTQVAKKRAEQMDCFTITVKDETIFTAAGRAREPEAAARLDSVIRQYDGEMTMRIRITGHAYVDGTTRYNQVVSADKARRVAEVLVYKHGFSYDDIVHSGKGKLAPRHDPTTPEGREQNNFVDLEFCVPKLAIVPEATPPPPDTLVIPDVLFKFNSDELNTNLYGALDSLVAKIPRGENVRLQLLGHTDNVGADDYNLDLSHRRAKAVADYLRQKGLEQYIRHVSGAGESRPVATNDTPEGRKQNRRVEIIIYKSAD
ncbi:hypothetical protein CCY01nite_12050 [Chitinophaga cymbidii]|uniref:OmpA-like domain-containing protein n=2 Tax=Chitinophaga cymbidii TaxID=1096750 RepID=A0A512RGX3_9BACT|nr:hypothetical protein CCY01nite_12050 [Chitinophaga cymbidii]